MCVCVCVCVCAGGVGGRHFFQGCLKIAPSHDGGARSVCVCVYVYKYMYVQVCVCVCVCVCMMTYLSSPLSKA